MPNETLYSYLESNPFVEKIYQTSAQEYWFKAIATFKQFWIESSLDSFDRSYAFLTNSPQVLLANFSNRLAVQAWFFTETQVFLSPTTFSSTQEMHVVKLDKKNPCADRLFFISITEEFAILFLSSVNEFLFSLHPEPIAIALNVLKQLICDRSQVEIFDRQVGSLPLIVPPYKVVSKFALVLLSQSFHQELPIPEISEVEIIRAIAHEVKTPLTIIRTLVQSLLRRQDIPEQVRYRLEKIDFECQDQIARFNLIFEIVKQDRQKAAIEFTDLDKILDKNLDAWQKQADRRQLGLSLDRLEPTPLVISNTQLLIQLLNSLVDRITRSLPINSLITISITIIGKYIKIQFKSKTDLAENALTHKAVGQWLMLQPDTGTLSLSLIITKVLFELIGAKLTIKTHPTKASYDGEIMNIFLPIKD
jgi:signal transduction histidine kinase